MSNIPFGWLGAEMSCVANISSGYGFPDRFQGNKSGEIPFVKVSDISRSCKEASGQLLCSANYISKNDLVTLSAKIVPAGSTVFAKIGEAVRLNRRALLGVGAVIDNNCMAITPLAVLMPKYAYYLLMTIDMAPFTVATTVPSIRKRDIESIKVSLPPLAEQKRIVIKIDSMTSRAQMIRNDIKKASHFISKIKTEVLRREFSCANSANRPLSDFITESLIGLVRSKEQQSISGGISYIRMQHFDLEGKWDFDNLTNVVANPDELTRYKLQSGDILFNTRNSFELVGKVALWSGDRSPYVYNNNILRLRFNKTVEPMFAYFQMQGPLFRDQLHQLKSATTSVSAIYQKPLMALPFWVPNLVTQRDIVHRVERTYAAIDRLEAEVINARKLVDRIEQSILAKAFRGELVPQDPNDEPASVLLDRIRAEHAAAGPAPKRTRRPRTAAGA